MAVERLDMFGDGSVSYEYHPGKRVVLRVNNFKVVVNKPYATQLRGGEVTIDKPSIQISTNQTVLTDLVSIELMIRAIKNAINMLNRENRGGYINENFSLKGHKAYYINDLPKGIC